MPQPRKLNNKGHAHWIVPVAAVVVIALIGGYVYQRASHADTVSTKSNLPNATAATNLPTAAQQLNGLTTLVASLQKGGQANVTAAAVTVPGPITNASARPLVFTVNGVIYFAYTQGSAPNFNHTSAAVAKTFAIVPATVKSPKLIGAHLDKLNNLVDANFKLAGYSTGGASAK